MSIYCDLACQTLVRLWRHSPWLLTLSPTKLLFLHLHYFKHSLMNNLLEFTQRWNLPVSHHGQAFDQGFCQDTFRYKQSKQKEKKNPINGGLNHKIKLQLTKSLEVSGSKQFISSKLSLFQVRVTEILLAFTARSQDGYCGSSQHFLPLVHLEERERGQAVPSHRVSSLLPTFFT